MKPKITFADGHTDPLIPICERENRCLPLPCCEPCRNCMIAQYYDGIRDLRFAQADIDQALEFFGGEIPYGN